MPMAALISRIAPSSTLWARPFGAELQAGSRDVLASEDEVAAVDTVALLVVGDLRRGAAGLSCQRMATRPSAAFALVLLQMRKQTIPVGSVAVAAAPVAEVVVLVAVATQR